MHVCTRSPWPLVWTLYLTGLVAAAQLGKLSALAPLVAAELGLGLPTVALAISLLEVGGATLGAAAGLLAQRLGLRRSLRWGLGALVLGGLGGAAAQGAPGLLGWRLLEAAGYLGVIVSAPVLIAHHSVSPGGSAGRRLQGQALALWSTFVPVGLALGAWSSASLAGTTGAGLGWRGAIALGAGVVALLWLAVWRLPMPAAAEAAVAPPERAGPAPGLVAGQAPIIHPTAASSAPLGLGAPAWCLALAFGGFALFEVGLMGLLPSLLVGEAGVSAAAAGRWTALASLAAVPGSAAAAWLLRHGGRLRWPMMLSLGLPAPLLFGVFTAAPVAGVAIALAIAISVLGGVFASLAFALLPVVAGSAGRMARVNGLLAQCGASGSLLGPPLMAACAQAAGWSGAAWLGLAVTALALPLAWRAVGWAASEAERAHGQAGHPLA